MFLLFRSFLSLSSSPSLSFFFCSLYFFYPMVFKSLDTSSFYRYILFCKTFLQVYKDLLLASLLHIYLLAHYNDFSKKIVGNEHLNIPSNTWLRDNQFLTLLRSQQYPMDKNYVSLKDSSIFHSSIFHITMITTTSNELGLHKP